MYSTSGANPTSPRRLPVALRNRARASVRVSSSPTAKLLFNLSIGRNPSSSTASRHALHTNRTSVYALAGAYANARCSKSFDTDAFPRAFPRASRPVVDVVLVLVVPPTANASASDSCLGSDITARDFDSPIRTRRRFASVASSVSSSSSSQPSRVISRFVSRRSSALDRGASLLSRSSTSRALVNMATRARVDVRDASHRE